MSLGDNVDIGTHCFLHSDVGGVSVGDHTMIGPLASIIGTNYSYSLLDRPVALQEKSSRGIRIGKGVWICAGAMILDGADIGDNVIVTPNSVVASRIPENSIVQGNPAQIIFTRR
jgi:acetyltransferase-like isoleucine patch superfamily enzyme